MSQAEPPPGRKRYFTWPGCLMIAILLATVLGFAYVFARRTIEHEQRLDSIEGEVRAILDAQVAAWNRGDVDGFMAGYWNDENLFYISGGKSVQGFNSLKERYATAYQGEGKEMGKLKFAELHIEPIGLDAALVRGRWEVTTSKESVGGWFTLLFRHSSDGWKIVHDHTSK
jgi:beta-aspartyl-peptidase (threonine type)